MPPLNVADLTLSIAPWTERLLTFGLVFARIAGLLSVGPLLGRAILPWQARATLAIVLSLLLAPLVSGPETTLDLAQLCFAAITELGQGFLLGSGSLLILWAIPLAGRLLDQQQALPADDDEDWCGGSPLARWLCLWGTSCFFFCSPINGHVQAVLTLADSFRAWPLGASTDLLDAKTAVELLQQSSQLALRLIAPALSVLALVNLAIGLLGAAGLPGISNGLGSSVRPIVAAVVVMTSLAGIQQSIADSIQEGISVLAGRMTASP